MVNILLVFVGAALMDDENTPTQNVVAATLLGVGLSRVINQLTEEDNHVSREN